MVMAFLDNNIKTNGTGLKLKSGNRLSQLSSSAAVSNFQRTWRRYC